MIEAGADDRHNPDGAAVTGRIARVAAGLPKRHRSERMLAGLGLGAMLIALR